LDRDLTFESDGSRWTFSEGKILLDGQEVNRMISGTETDVSLWLGMAAGLNEYRKGILARSRGSDRLSRFEGVIEALLTKIFGRLKRVYDQKTTGVAWKIENGQLIINGINVRSFLAFYRLRPTVRARTFLEGLRRRLHLLLEGTANEKIHGMVLELCDEIQDGLSPEETPRPGRPPPDRNPLDR